MVEGEEKAGWYVCDGQLKVSNWQVEGEKWNNQIGWKRMIVFIEEWRDGKRACLLYCWGLNSGEITSSSWDCSTVLHVHFSHVDFVSHTHTHTSRHTLLWVIANSIIAWSNHFQIQWRHLCQVHRRSRHTRKHAHTSTHHRMILSNVVPLISESMFYSWINILRSHSWHSRELARWAPRGYGPNWPLIRF